MLPVYLSRDISIIIYLERGKNVDIRILRPAEELLLNGGVFVFLPLPFIPLVRTSPSPLAFPVVAMRAADGLFLSLLGGSA